MLKADDWLKRYKFCQPLGQGGMGTIYLAEDRANKNAQCIIKQLTKKYEDANEQKEAIRLFEREASILSNLHHPGIVRIFDSFAGADGLYFLVMDYIAGKDLEAMVKNIGKLSNEAVVGVAIQCCEVLEYLHTQHPPVIYRDLKPSNLMLNPDGRIIFIDFGIARSFLPKQAATRVVTAGYSPPEQYFGKPETRSDLYSLGATISHLVTGQRPKPLSLCAPALFNPLVLPSLDQLVRHLTAHDVDERPPTAQLVRWELYKIYKEMHPEFIIPPYPKPEAKNNATPQEKSRLKSDGTTAQSSPYPNEVKLTSSSAAESSSIAAGKQYSFSAGATLWRRLKQWIKIWVS